MKNWIKWKGIHRGYAYAWDLKSFPSGSRSVRVSLAAEEFLRDGVWDPIDPAHTTADIWVIGKDGQLNGEAVAVLTEVLGWDGTFGAFAKHPTFEKKPCQFSVDSDEYKDKVFYSGAFLKPYDFTPKSKERSPEELAATAAAAAQLDAEFGAKVRALSSPGQQAQGGPATGPSPTPAAPPSDEGFDEVPF